MKRTVLYCTALHLLEWGAFLGNTAQSPPDGLAAHLLAAFSSSCTKTPCWAHVSQSETAQFASKRATAQRRRFHTI